MFLIQIVFNQTALFVLGRVIKKIRLKETRLISLLKGNSRSITQHTLYVTFCLLKIVVAVTDHALFIHETLYTFRSFKQYLHLVCIAKNTIITVVYFLLFTIYLTLFNFNSTSQPLNMLFLKQLLTILWPYTQQQ